MRTRFLSIVIISIMAVFGANAATLRISKSTNAPASRTSPGAPSIQIPTTNYVQEYLRTYTENPDLELNNVGDRKIASEKYIMSAIDFVNGDTDYAKNARENVLVPMTYLESAANEKVNTCAVPWGTSTFPQTMSYVSMDFEFNSTAIEFGYNDWHSVAYGDGKYVAIAAFSDVAAYSTDGINWVATSLPMWGGDSVAYGNGMFIAVTGDYSGTDVAAYSTNGIDWTEMYFPVAQNWSSIVYGDDKFVVIAENGVGVYSYDGMSWTQTILPVSEYWQSVTYGDGKFVAVAGGSRNIAAYSADGITWTQTTLPASAYWESVTYGDGKFVAVARYTDIAAYSTDGINWTQTILPVSEYWESVTYGDGKFVAVARYTDIAAYSADGVNWSTSTLPIASEWIFVTFVDGKFMAGALGSGFLAYSVDGINWNTSNISYTVSNFRADSIAYGDGKFVGVYFGSDIVGVSTDGLNWYSAPLSINGFWKSVTYGGGKFVAVGGWDGDRLSSGTCIYSTDGISWKSAPLPSSEYWNSVTYGDGKFVAVAGGDYGPTKTVAYSFDGINWDSTTLPMRMQWQTVAYGNGVFVALPGGYSAPDYPTQTSSDKGAYSFDGITWNTMPLSVDQVWSSVAYGNGMFVAVGGGHIIYSHDGINWDNTTIPCQEDDEYYYEDEYCFIHWDHVVYGDGIFIITNGSDTSAYSLDGKHWSPFLLQECYLDANMAYGNGTFVAIDVYEYKACVLAFSSASTNPWAVGDGCTAGADVATMCTSPLVGGTATCDNAKCSCVRTHLIDKSGTFVENAATNPVTINRTFESNDACNTQCANICADNAVNNTDGAQKAILCGK